MQLGISVLGAPADEAKNLLPISRKILPDFLRCIDVRRAVDWRWVSAKKRDNADKNGFNRMDRQPSLRCTLIPVLVVTRGVEDGDAEVSISVNVGVPHGSEKLEGWWQKRILGRERQSCLEDAPFIEGVARADDDDLPFIDVALVDESGREAFDWFLGELE